MAIANQLYEYLKSKGSDYTLLGHPHSGSSMQTAEAAQVPGDALAKGVVLRDDAGTLLVVVASDYHVELNTLNTLLGRQLAFVAEDELGGIFPDCELGAVPPIGAAYAIDTVWDPQGSLGAQDYIYFEAGDHATLVRVSTAHFRELMATAEQAHFSHHI
jgi:Ala-tRNA(Pro) deacylase